MGKCKYCGQDAGLLKSKHPECAELHDNGAARNIYIYPLVVLIFFPGER